jgi:hypothetical protein
MPTIIKTKNSVTAASAPSSLQQGEVAINITDKKVWVGNAATTPVQLLGTGADGTFTNITVTSVATFAAGTVSAPSITTTGDTNTGIFFPAGGASAFTNDGVESMRIDSAGDIGVGVNAPSVRLDVNKANPTRGIVSRVRNSASSSLNGAQLLFTQNTVADWTIGQPANENAFAFWGSRNSSADGTEWMRLTNAGSLGIGTGTPSQRLSVIGGGVAFGGSATLGANTTGFVFSYDNPNCRLFFGDGTGYTFRFSARASSTTTDLMTIRDNGNIGVGTSSPSAAAGKAFSITGGNEQVRLTFKNTTTGDASGDGFQVGIDVAGEAILENRENTRMRFATNAVEQMILTTAGLLQFNSGYGSVATAYGTRAWVNFNGVGTVAIRASGNVSSITDNGNGDYTVNFSTGMPDANYAITGTSSNLATNTNTFLTPITYSTGSARVLSKTFDNVPADREAVSVVITR